jgi:glycosyltransferase involved in cell wall biosynthesis
MPALVGKLVAEALGIPYSFSAHARDVFVPEFRLGPLCRNARFVAVCSAGGRSRLRDLLPAAPPVTLIDLHHVPRVGRDEGATASRDASRFRIMALGRLVEKKGTDVVIRALGMARRRGLGATLHVVGDGPLRRRLAILARLELGEDGIIFHGSRPHAEAMHLLAESDLLVLGSRTTPEGDRDGVPNSILEAMALSVPVLSTRAGGIPEVVHDMETGLLVPPDDPDSMSEGISRLAADPELRRRLAGNALEAIRRRRHDRDRQLESLLALCNLRAPVRQTERDRAPS